MYNFSPLVQAELEEAGWFEGRSVDTDRIVQLMKDDGFTVVPRAVDFMREFGELWILRQFTAGGWDIFNTFVKDWDTVMWENLEITSSDVGEVVSPLATCGDRMEVVVIGTSGKIYWEKSTGIYILGESFEEALENILSQKRQKLTPLVAFPLPSC